jgi:hypothetical protein
MGDWPIIEYLKHHFSNKQSYENHVKCNHAAAARDKGKGKPSRYDIGLHDLHNFGSDMDVIDNGGEDGEAGEEEF